MKVLHLICKRSKTSAGLQNVDLLDREKGIWRSGKWDFNLKEARSLVGGRLYLHETKARSSSFGGEVLDVEPVRDESLARADRVWFIIRPTLEDKGVPWRGASHAMASYGGIQDV